MNTQLKINEIKRAVLRGDDTFDGKPLSKVQSAGTGVQINSHAKQIATNFYNEHYKK